MTNGTRQAQKKTAETVTCAMPKQALDWTRRVWRPAGTVVAAGLALLLGWHVVDGKNGLTAWHNKRAQDHQLQREIKDLDLENAQLRERIERLKFNPDAVGMLARETLHYVKSNEVIATLPPEAKDQAKPTAVGK
jgi:cell division protein FtsB